MRPVSLRAHRARAAVIGKADRVALRRGECERGESGDDGSKNLGRHIEKRVYVEEARSRWQVTSERRVGLAGNVRGSDRSVTVRTEGDLKGKHKAEAPLSLYRALPAAPMRLSGERAPPGCPCNKQLALQKMGVTDTPTPCLARVVSPPQSSEAIREKHILPGKSSSPAVFERHFLVSYVRA